MNLIKPKKLQQGDTIGILSVSGDIRDYSRITESVKYFQNKGFKVKVSDTTSKKFRYHSGTDNERVSALQDFFLDNEIDAIVCSRGGYGVLRILNDINYNIIAENPKILCGYSDITALLLMIYKKTGMVSFHGAMANGDFGEKNVSEFTEKSFFKTLTKSEILTFSAGKKGKTLKNGNAQGILWGGNLATIASMAGLDFLPDEKFVFFVEDVNEPPYKVDRMFTQLFNLEKFAKNLSAVALGEFSGIEKMNTVYDVVLEYANRYNLPCCSGFAISHEADKYTLPIGLQCLFDADKKLIVTKESAFSA